MDTPEPLVALTFALLAGQDGIGTDKSVPLTTLAAMIGGVVILADPIFQGLALSLLFGLLTSTALTVLVVPAVYRVFKT